MAKQYFQYDVFINYHRNDKKTVYPIAKRLRADGVRVWWDQWIIKPGDSIPALIEEGLESARILVLCMSANAFGAGWSQLESQTFRFRDPLNRERRFIPLRLDDAEIKGSLVQFAYIDWSNKQNHEQEYAKLLHACGLKPQSSMVETERRSASLTEKTIQLSRKESENIYAYAFSADGKRLFSASSNHTMQLWDLETKRILMQYSGHTDSIWCVAWHADSHYILSGSDDCTIRLWEVETGHCLHILTGHTGIIWSLAWSHDLQFALSASDDHTIRLWQVKTGECLRIFKGHTNIVSSVTFSADQRFALSGSADKTVRLWDIKTGKCIRTMEGHTEIIWCVAFSADQSFALSGSADNTIRLWDVYTGQCLYVMEGHTGIILDVAWSADQRYFLSGSSDKTVRLWDVNARHCLCILESHTAHIKKVVWSVDPRYAFSGDQNGDLIVWNLSDYVSVTLPLLQDQVQYANAKAADFKTLTGKQLGVKLTRQTERFDVMSIRRLRDKVI